MILSTKIFSTKFAASIAHRVFLVVLMASCLSLRPLRAQEQPVQPEQKQPASPDRNKQASEDSKQRANGPGRQLAHESNEAAGEGEDEMGEFKKSASVRAIAHGSRD